MIEQNDSLGLKKEVQEKGFCVLKGFFTSKAIERYRSLCEKYFKENKSYKGHGGKIVPGWAGSTPTLEELNHLHENKEIVDVSRKILGNNSIFIEHSDLHQNKSSGWHTDTKDYERGGGSLPNWNENFFVIKISVLLQDHLDNNLGLWVKPKSHRNIMTQKPIPLNTNKEDLIIFDQKILHKGMDNPEAYRRIYQKNRYLITLGYGLDNSETHIHIRGCKKRQEQQRKKMT